MTKLELEIHEDVISVINKIKSTNDAGIELIIPEGSVLFENVLNLKILEKEAEQTGKTLHFTTEDESGLNLIAAIKDGVTPSIQNGPEESPKPSAQKRRGVPTVITLRARRARTTFPRNLKSAGLRC
jgi:hypothetical protein